MGGLSDLLWSAIVTLQRAGAATSEEVQGKFAGSIELSYSGLDTFFGGLEGVIGSPDPKLFLAMQNEHTMHEDADREFTTRRTLVAPSHPFPSSFLPLALPAPSLPPPSPCTPPHGDAPPSARHHPSHPRHDDAREVHAGWSFRGDHPRSQGHRLGVGFASPHSRVKYTVYPPSQTYQQHALAGGGSGLWGSSCRPSRLWATLAPLPVAYRLNGRWRVAPIARRHQRAQDTVP